MMSILGSICVGDYDLLAERSLDDYNIKDMTMTISERHSLILLTCHQHHFLLTFVEQ